MTRALPVVRKSDSACVCLFTVLLVSGAGILCSRHSLGQEPAERIRVGERVVLRSGEVALRMDGRDVERSRREIHFYRVEALDGATVKLKAEGDWIVGSVHASEVIPVAGGTGYFTSLIGADPKNAYAFLMRSLLRLDRRELETALADADQAVRLAPRDSCVYSALAGRFALAGGSISRRSRTSMKRSGSIRATRSPTEAEQLAGGSEVISRTPSPI